MKTNSTFTKLSQLFLDLLSFIFEKVATLFFGIGLLLTTPFLVLGAIPFLLYRHALNKLGPRIKPSLGSMVTARGSVFAMDAIYNRKKPLISLVVQSQLKDRIELSRLREIVETRVLPARENNSTGNLKFPELRQFLTVWGGYFFWEWDPAFNLDNHLKYHLLESQLDAEGKETALTKFHEDLLQRPWQKNKPLWEIHLVDVDEIQNSEPNHNQINEEMQIKTTSTLFLWSSHSLMDGYSVLYLVSEHFSESGTLPDHAKPILAHRPVWRTTLFFTTFPFRAALESCSILAARINPFTSLPFTVPWTSQGVAPMIFTSTKALSVSKIKSIKDHFQVSFTSVVYTALTGGLRELMLSKGVSHPPIAFPILIPLPLKGRPGAGLRNYLGGALSYLPTRGRNPISRLRACDRDVTRLKRSTFPLLSFIGVKICGCGPAWVLRLFCRNWFSSSYLTNFPGGTSPLNVGGVEISALKAGLGLFAGPTGLGFTAVSYQNDLWISVTADGTLFSREEIEDLTKACEGQIDLLVEKIEESV